ncbi:alpha/beta fold hydrolase [Nocardia rosealba]|uniref:alpha/beta fold hydrolase n=1 Tax=Nocardia rosealba TaxID=2878563 RepID=UPI001CDA4AAC|nr:alpha/beta hydrolase [Nocardia rosealba]MCA2206771.1 alpha/beta fold hydrolase [Nocardia rosealba]
MAKIGRFKNDAAREEYLRTYRELEKQWPVPSEMLDIPTSFGMTKVRKSGAGQGIPFVLMHSLGGNSLMWRHVIEDFARDHVVYAPEMIGAPGLSVQTAPIDETKFGAWLGEVLDGLGVERVHLVGYSQGAWQAMAVATTQQARLASLSVVEPSGTLTKIKWSLLWTMLRVGARPTDKNLRAMNARLNPGVTLTDAEFAGVKAALGYAPTIGYPKMFTDERLATITTPTLLLLGSESLVVDPQLAEQRVRDNLPTCEVEIFPGVGHGLFYQISRQVTARILDFARRYEHIDARHAE